MELSSVSPGKSVLIKVDYISVPVVNIWIRIFTVLTLSPFVLFFSFLLASFEPYVLLKNSYTVWDMAVEYEMQIGTVCILGT